MDQNRNMGDGPSQPPFKKTKFAWLPRRLSNGHWIWLQSYRVRSHLR